MFSFSFFKGRIRTSRPGNRPKPRLSFRPRVEELENRIVPAGLNFYVDNTPTDPNNVPGDGDEVFTPNGGTQTQQGGLTLGQSLFTTIQAAIDAAGTDDIINVADGTYAENVVVNKQLTLKGNQFGVDPNTQTRGAETIVLPAVTATSVQASTSGTVFRVGTLSGHIDVTIDGFKIDGHNANLTNGRALNGVEIDTGAGIVNSIESFDTNPGGFDVKLTVHNNVIQNLERYGVLIENTPS